MKQRSENAIYIKPRDCALFEYLFLHRIATTKQIHRDVFKTTTENDMRTRLRQLQKENYVKHIALNFTHLIRGFYLSNKAFRKYFSKRIERKYVQLKSDSPAHDVVLVDIRNRFLRSKKVGLFLTENAIEAKFDCPRTFPVQAFLDMHSDGAIIFKNNGKSFNVAVEYENSSQNDQRYEEQFHAYYMNHEINGIIYIASNARLCSKLKEIDKDFCTNRKSKIFLGQIDPVLNESDPLRFSNNTGEVLCLD